MTMRDQGDLEVVVPEVMENDSMDQVRDYMAGFDGSFEYIARENSRLVTCLNTVVSLDPRGRAEFFDSMFRELPQQFGLNVDMSMRYWYVDLMLEMANLGMDDKARRVGEFTKYFVGRMDQFMPDPFKKDASDQDIDAWCEYNAVLNGDHQRVIYESLLDYPSDQIEKRDHILGLIMRFKGMPAVANDLRKLMVDQTISEVHRNEATKIVGEILGLDELEKKMKAGGRLAKDGRLEVHAFLGGVYKKCNFAEYEVSLRTKEFRMRNLQGIFEKVGIGKGVKICDAGCGTGWLMEELMKAGYTHVSGFDNDATELATARDLLPAETNLSEGDLYSMNRKYKDDPQDALLVMGRTITHAETEYYLEEILLSAFGTLDDEKGGYLIFDLPDTEVSGGAYEENMEFYKNVLRRYGYTDKELEDFCYIVDSPDGENFYNRLVPKIARAIVLAEQAGFVPVKDAFLVEELPNDRGDMNVVLVFKKLSEVEEDAKMKADEEAWSPKPVKYMWET